MAAFLVLDVHVIDGEAYDEYLVRVPAVVHEHGGSYVVRGGLPTPLAGGWEPERFVVIEFPDREAIDSFLRSDGYAELTPLRDAGAEMRSIIVDGLDDEPG